MGSKVSIIVIVSNTEAYLKKCMYSLVNQTLKEIEIIVVDDFSDTDIATIVNEFLDDSRVSFVQLNSKYGPGGARNIGLKRAKGQYISFIDSDDWVDINFFEVAYNYVLKENAQIGMCGLVRNYEVELSEKVYKCKYNQLISLTGDTAFRIMTKQYDYGINIIPSSVNRIYEANFLMDNHLAFVEGHFYEDLLFSFKALLSAQKIICIPSVYYHHYKRIGSIVQSFSLKHIEDFKVVFSSIREFLIAENLYTEYKFNYYKFGEQFYNLLIRQIFEFIYNETERKEYMRISFNVIKSLIDFDEYFEYCSAEKLRQHIQPQIKSTTIL